MCFTYCKSLHSKLEISDLGLCNVNKTGFERTSLKLHLRLLSELTLREGVAISGCTILQHSSPVDGSEHRHQHPQQRTYKKHRNTELQYALHHNYHMLVITFLNF